MRSFISVIGYLLISQLRNMEKHSDRPVAEMPMFLGEGVEQQILNALQATTPSLLNDAISASLMPTKSRRISSVCWPSKGGGVLMPGFEYEYLTGVLTICSGPQAGCSIVVTMLRASTGENN